MRLERPLVLNEGVYLVPVTDLAQEVRSKIEADDDAFALTRPQGRTGSKILDRDAAGLVERFREPRTIIEAVILWSRSQGEDPEAVLDGAYPLIKGLLASGYLIPLADGEAAVAAGESLAARWRAGDEVLGVGTLAARVLRVVQVLEDTEIYLLERAGITTILKIERTREGHSGRRIRAMLEREAEVLAALPTGLAPKLLTSGESEGRRYFEMEAIFGTEIEAAAGLLREAAELGLESARREHWALLRTVAHAYALLHEHGFLHGDVHPRNLLVERSGAVRLIDFGLATLCGDREDQGERGDRSARGDLGDRGDRGDRGGVPFFYEPELARAYAAGGTVPVTAAGEQFALAALLFRLATGTHRRDYSLGREEMLRELAELPPLPFRDRGVAPWPDLEAVLARGLALDPAERFPSVAHLAAALDDVSLPAPSERSGRAAAKLGEWLLALDLDGATSASSLPEPSASINYGAAGVALGLLAIGHAQGEPRPLALARPWLGRALAQLENPSGFYATEIEITEETVGAASPYHSPAGLFAVEALLARARGDLATQARATSSFLVASERGHKGLDLTLGLTSTLLGVVHLLDAWPESGALPVGFELDDSPLRKRGDDLVSELWRALDAQPTLSNSEIDYLGIAHGWAGFLYATLLWCRLTGAPIPSEVERRANELAVLARPSGRGLVWPWMLRGDGASTSMPGWCNGSAGYVFCWTLAAESLGRPEWLDLAVGAAWDAWEAPDLAASLCCGLAGRGYALANLYRATGERVWLDRARQLSERAIVRGSVESGHPHSLWKGELGPLVLAADLERPDSAAMPFFEPLGYRLPSAR